MDKVLEEAKKILLDNDFTCVATDGDNICISNDRGIKRLVYWYEHKSIDGYMVADKVVGRGAAFVYVLIGVRCIWAKIISDAAIEIFNMYNINFFYDKRVENISNRNNTDICPIEASLADVYDLKAAMDIIRRKLKDMDQLLQ